MGSTFLFPPTKRPIQYSSGMADPNPTANGFSNKRSKQPPSAAQPLVVPAGHVSFRLLCHASRVGGIIGKSGNIIKQLQQQTGAKIRVEEAPVESPDRVITVIGEKSSLVSKVMVESEEIEVSKAQEGLIRVFERILEVAAESDGINVAAGGGGIVSCRLLAEAKQVGSVIGKGGKVVEKIRKDCGVKIRVLTDKLPVCALSYEEMVEIEGDVLAVKKALIAVSRCLQDCQPVDKPRITGNKPFEAVSQEPDMHVEIPLQRNIIPPTMPSSTISYAPVTRHLSLDSDRFPSLDTKLMEQVVFKILCLNEMVGGVIGKGGTIIKALQNETGASITIGTTIAECDERLITVTASENPESRYSAAQKATVLVFSLVSRSMEAGTEKVLDSSSGKGFSCAARLVVPSNQVGCLLGKGGIIISEMRKMTGTSIKVLGGDQLPKCVPVNEQVVQISGEFMNVKDAVYHVTGRLRDNLFSSTLGTPVTRSTTVLTEASPYERLREPWRDSLREPMRDALREPLGDALGDPLRDARRDFLRDPLGDTLRDPYPLRDSLKDPFRKDTLKEPLRGPPAPYNLHSSVGVSHGLNRHTTLTQSMDDLGLSHSLYRPTSPRLWASQTMATLNPRGIPDASRGLTSFKGSLELGSGSKSAIVTNTTVEIRVPEDVIGSVYGENGNNLTRLRQISGAKVIVHEPHLGSSDRIIDISGTPDQTQAAQSLLQAFILTGQS